MPMRLNVFSPLCAAAGALAALVALAAPVSARSAGSAPLQARSAGSAPLPARSVDSPFGAFAPALAPSPPRLAQHSPVPPRGRAVADSFQGNRSNENRSFEELMRSAQARGRGEFLGVEPDISRNVYRFKFMRPGGNVVWVDVDGRTARVLSERD